MIPSSPRNAGCLLALQGLGWCSESSFRAFLQKSACLQLYSLKKTEMQSRKKYKPLIPPSKSRVSMCRFTITDTRLSRIRLAVYPVSSMCSSSNSYKFYVTQEIGTQVLMFNQKFGHGDNTETVVCTKCSSTHMIGGGAINMIQWLPFYGHCTGSP